MRKPKLMPFYVIPRFHPKHKEVLLFLPDNPANGGNIDCYAHIGQHSEASLDYYRETKPIPPNRLVEAGRLLREYESFLDESEVLVIRKRDTPKFRRIRQNLGRHAFAANPKGGECLQ